MHRKNRKGTDESGGSAGQGSKRKQVFTFLALSHTLFLLMGLMVGLAFHFMLKPEVREPITIISPKEAELILGLEAQAIRIELLETAAKNQDNLKERIAN